MFYVTDSVKKEFLTVGAAEVRKTIRQKLSNAVKQLKKNQGQTSTTTERKDTPMDKFSL